ncbi:sigma-E processing peptidase SpoIIGA [Aureibacillus halotolerans]|uniref:Sporulation sigma-E factor-processing peptidase n=1 Tax=Aureibacillus halotolerans TaxID=1508390 RepID=A0A4R6UC55_9BACI|nr:sigma-E processing peptidase SpoIIGA [Aureibacillus halotolerans]TDQ42335.1 sporulation factor SpoIIGA [Aureibacillus halotolerans]
MYADVIWLLNLLFDTWLLWLTAIVLKRSVSIKRLLLGGFVGSVIVIGVLSPYSVWFSHPLTKLVISVLMVLTTFGFHKFKAVGQALLTLYFLTFAIGGGMIAILNLLDSSYSVEGNVLTTTAGGFGHPVSWAFVLGSFPVLLYFSKRRLTQFETKAQTYEGVFDFRLTLHDSEIRGKGFVDTGNHLREPVSGHPVIFLNAALFNAMDPWMEKMIAAPMEAVASPLGNERAFCLIPFRTMGNTSSMVAGFYPEELMLSKGASVWTTTKVLVAFTSTNISPSGEYDALLHPSLVSSHPITYGEAGG